MNDLHYFAKGTSVVEKAQGGYGDEDGTGSQLPFVGQIDLVRAFSWQLHEDLTQFNIFRVEMIVPSWTQYVLQRDRMTKAEKNIIERARNLHIGQGPIREGIFLCVNKELVSHRRLAERQWRLQKRSP